MRDVLTINSYAGSLVIGAQMAGFPIRRSMEDSGYGIEGQRLNWPDLKYVYSLPWPEDDLSSTMVIAHPPCSAFSGMNIIPGKKGLDTDAVKCHKLVMDYAMGNRCEALAIESVQGALKFKDFYTEYAAKYGYSVCFVLLNSISFGVPQWRKRFWAVFYRDLKLFYFSLVPKYVCLQEVLNGEPVTNFRLNKAFQYHDKKFARGKDFDFKKMLRETPPGAFDAMAKRFFKEKDPMALKNLTGTLGLYRAGLPRKLDPALWAPVVLGFSTWYVGERPLNRTEYMRIMGFPDNYRWTEKLGKDFLTYLSKGICPPVGAWILQQMDNNLEANLRMYKDGDVVDLQPNKGTVEAILKERWGRMTTYGSPALKLESTLPPTPNSLDSGESTLEAGMGQVEDLEEVEE